jgi:hypothetical protein
MPLDVPLLRSDTPGVANGAHRAISPPGGAVIPSAAGALLAFRSL